MAFDKTLREIVIYHHCNGHKASYIRGLIAYKVSLSSIQKWIKEYKKNGFIKKKFSKLERKKRVLTEFNSKRVKRFIKKGFSVRKINKITQISIGSIIRISKKFNLKSYVKQKTPLLTGDHMVQRLRIARWWRKTNAGGMGKKKIMFSDEKLFTLNGGLNKQNDRVRAVSREEANKLGGLKTLQKYPMSIMVWCGLTQYGPILYFLNKGERIDGKYYTRKILPLAKKKGNEMFGSRNWVFQQDGASCHTSNLAQNWCKNNFKHFIPKDKWPPNSPDLNPLDYYFWDAVVTRMNSLDQIATTREEFQNEIIKATMSVPRYQIIKALNAFHGRVRRVENSKGGRANNK